MKHLIEEIGKEMLETSEKTRQKVIYQCLL